MQGGTERKKKVYCKHQQKGLFFKKKALILYWFYLISSTGCISFVSICNNMTVLCVCSFDRNALVWLTEASVVYVENAYIADSPKESREQQKYMTLCPAVYPDIALGWFNMLTHRWMQKDGTNTNTPEWWGAPSGGQQGHIMITSTFVALIAGSR